MTVLGWCLAWIFLTLYLWKLRDAQRERKTADAILDVAEHKLSEQELLIALLSAPELLPIQRQPQPRERVH